MEQYFKPINPNTANSRGSGRYDINIEKIKSTDTIPAILIIDSSKRNRDEYENPGRYTVQLPTVYTDVISIELVQANIPNSAYSINARNNLITFNYDNDDDGTTETYTATLNHGNYNETTITTEISNAIDALFPERTQPTNSFNVEYNYVTQRLSISTPKRQIDNINLQTNKEITLVAGRGGGADRIIGLGSSNVSSVDSNLTLPYSLSLKPDRYVVMHILGMERCDGNSNALSKCFCTIPVDSSSPNSDFTIKSGNIIDNDNYICYFSEPIPKLKKLDITFYSPDGTIYDFNGRDHFLVFEITCLSRPTKLRS